MTKPDQNLSGWAQYLAESIMLDAETDDQLDVTRIRAKLMLHSQSVILRGSPAALEDEKLQCKARIMSTLFGPLIDHLCEIKREVACLDIVGQPQYKAIQKLDMLIQVLTDMTGTRASLDTWAVS